MSDLEIGSNLEGGLPPPPPSVEGRAHPKLPPQNLEAETHVLGGLLMDPENLERVAEHLEPTDFYQRSHQQIYAAILELNRQGTKADLITLTDFLQAQKSLPSVGGASYLARLVDLMPTSANLDSYAKLIREKAIARELIRVGTGIVESAYSGGNSVNELLDKVERDVFQVAHRQMSQSTSSLRDMVMQAFKSIQERFEKKSAVTGLATGFDGFDRLTSGLQKTDLIILAARPSVGKTAFGLNLALNVALRENVPTVVFSLEMSKEQLVQRLLALESRVDGGRIRGGFLSDEDWPRLTHAASVLSEAPVFIDDTPGLSIFELRAKCRRLAKSHGLGFVIVDYLQLMRVKGRVESREREIAEISMSLKALSKELGIPVLALSQLNRSLESRQDKRPVLSDLRESGSIEQDADLIMFLYRDEVYHPDTDSPGVAEVILAKHRNGPTGVVKLAFLKEYTRFENLADDELLL
ncbi:MAG: replicative DNA helicase [Bradymonadales bacterium]|nr:MAG: replicative DNA helicase [Bradymonadales bacterium]